MIILNKYISNNACVSFIMDSIKESTAKEDNDKQLPEVVFINSEKGNPVLLRNGYRFYFGCKNKTGTTIWRCVHRSMCSGSVTLNENQVSVLREGQHTCLASSSETSNKVQQAIDLCRKRARTECTPIQKIYDESFKDLMDQGMKFVAEVPTFESLKSGLYNCRRQEYNVSKLKFNAVKEVEIPDYLANDFLIINNGCDDKIIVFMTVEAMKILPSVDDFFGDGTFKSCSDPFYQIYSIHGDINSTENSSNIFPLVYILLPNKTEETYTRMLSLILQKNPNWQPKTFRIDYEIAMMNAIQKVFPHAKCKGCFFHYCQAVTRKAKLLNMESLSEIKFTYLTTALALMPCHYIPEGWLTIKDSTKNTNNVINFIEYFEKQWLTPKMMQMLSCYGDQHRTTNNVEGWHRKVNRDIGPLKDSLVYVVSFLKEEAKRNDFKILRAIHNIEVKKRRPAQSIKNKRIQSILDELLNNKISVLECLNKLRVLPLLKKELTTSDNDTNECDITCEEKLTEKNNEVNTCDDLYTLLASD